MLTQWNAAGCKTLNNDHYVYTYYQRLSAFRVLLLCDWLYKVSVSFSHFFPWQCSHVAWRNFQWTKLQWYNSGYIKFRLAFNSHFFPRQCSHTAWRNFKWTKLQWYNSFWNLVLTIVDQRNIDCYCCIKNVLSLRNDCSNNLNLQVFCDGGANGISYSLLI